MSLSNKEQIELIKLLQKIQFNDIINFVALSAELDQSLIYEKNNMLLMKNNQEVLKINGNYCSRSHILNFEVNSDLEYMNPFTPDKLGLTADVHKDIIMKNI